MVLNIEKSEEQTPNILKNGCRIWIQGKKQLPDKDKNVSIFLRTQHTLRNITGKRAMSMTDFVIRYKQAPDRALRQK